MVDQGEAGECGNVLAAMLCLRQAWMLAYWSARSHGTWGGLVDR